jgi:hypothetical protein
VEELRQELCDVVEELGLPPDRIINIDETGLNYKRMPSYTLAVGGDSGAGGVASKQRITVCMAVNASGSLRQTVVIGSSAKPKGTDSKFFKDRDILYFSSKNAWMTREIFMKVLSDLNNRVSALSVVFLDNFSGHTGIPNVHLLYPKLQLYFLPPRTT